MYFDAHTHLNEAKLFPNRQNYLQSFFDLWWQWLVNIGIDHQHNLNALHIAKESYKKYPDKNVLCTIWLHPGCVGVGDITNANHVAVREQLVTLFNANKEHISAIGEAGIDTYYDWFEQSLPLQQQLFSQQCILAQENNLAIVIHSRANYAATKEVLEKYPDLTVYFHCRGYTPDEVIDLFDSRDPAKTYIWFCGNITYKKAQEIRDSFFVVRNQQPQSVLLETDAPYLTPQAVRKEQNQPAFVRHIYEYVADHFIINEQQLQQQITDNFRRIYQIS